MTSSAASPSLSLVRAAEYAELSLPTLRRAIRSGRLRAIRVNGGRVYRVRMEWLETYLRTFSCGAQAVDEDVR